jgi:hypothetical protein
VLLGFSSRFDEAAFQLSKARHLQQQDGAAALLVACFTCCPLLVMWRCVPQLARADVPLGLCAPVALAWCACHVLPAVAYFGARRWYLGRRDWVWAASTALCGLHGLITWEVVMADSMGARMNAVLISRAYALAAMEFLVRPAFLRLSCPQQLLASLGSMLSLYHASQGPADGPYSLPACLVMAGVPLVNAYLADSAARRRWLAARALPAAGGACGAGEGSSSATGRAGGGVA